MPKKADHAVDKSEIDCGWHQLIVWMALKTSNLSKSSYVYDPFRPTTRSFIGIYCARYVKWRIGNEDGILVLAEQIKQNKDQDLSFPMRWPVSGGSVAVVTVFGICFYIVRRPSPRFDRFPDLFLFESHHRDIWMLRPTGFCPEYFPRTAIICNNRVFAVNGGDLMLCIGGSWIVLVALVIVLVLGGGENYSYIGAPSMGGACSR